MPFAQLSFTSQDANVLNASLAGHTFAVSLSQGAEDHLQCHRSVERNVEEMKIVVLLMFVNMEPVSILALEIINIVERLRNVWSRTMKSSAFAKRSLSLTLLEN